MAPRRWLLLALSLLAVATSCGNCTEGSGNQPPTVVLSGVPSNDTFLVGEIMRINIDANDPEGGDLTFDWDYKPKDLDWTAESRAEFLKFTNSAVFEWDPLASDALNDEPIQLIFIVTDVAGETTEKVVTLNILPGNGKPVFQSSASELYDPRGGMPLSFRVSVTDQDSEMVTIDIDQASKPGGSSFMQDDPYGGTFTWMPTTEQLERRVYSVNFTADDGENPVEEFKVTIVIRSPTAVVVVPNQTEQLCPGEAVVSHTPIGPQRDPAAPYRFEARILNPSYDRAVLYLSQKSPFNGEPASAEEDRAGDAIEMTNEGDVFVAEVQPLTAYVDSNGSATIYYQICAFDDDASGADAIACAPSSGDLELWNTFTVYAPDADDCVEDALDATSGNDDFATAVIMDESWATSRVCDANPDFYSVELREGESALFSAVYNAGGPVSFEAFDNDQNPVELKQSSCTGLVTAEVVAPPGGGTFYLKASGSNANYSIRAFKSGNAAECSDASAEPNDDASNATAATDGASLMGEICPDGSDIDVYSIALAAGDELSVTHTFSNAAGNLDMTLFSPSQMVDRSGTGSAFTFGLTDEEVLTHTAAETGTYNLLIFNNNEGTNAYQLQFAVTAAPPCADSDAAGRSEADAMIIAADDTVTLAGMAVCPGAADWLQRTEFGPVLGELIVTGGDGTIDDVTLTVYDAMSNIVATGQRVAQRLDFDFFPAATGQHYYKIETTNRVEYELTLLR